MWKQKSCQIVEFSFKIENLELYFFYNSVPSEYDWSFRGSGSYGSWSQKTDQWVTTSRNRTGNISAILTSDRPQSYLFLQPFVTTFHEWTILFHLDRWSWKEWFFEAWRHVWRMCDAINWMTPNVIRFICSLYSWISLNIHLGTIFCKEKNIAENPIARFKTAEVICRMPRLVIF